MSRRHPSDFIKVRPWGNVGDRKNDGYLPSKRTLFQVYAPNEMTAAKAIEKIEEDFADALPHWQTYFDQWTFVHNDQKGLGPDIVKCLLSLQANNKPITCGHWGYEALEQEAMQLAPSDLEAVFGLAPDSRSFSAVRNEDLVEVLEGLIQSHSIQEVDIKPVSIKKLHKNDLGVDSITYLQTGQLKSGQVRDIFDKFPDPMTGEKIAQGFRDEYLRLKTQGLKPDAILSQLIAYAEGYGNNSITAKTSKQSFQGAIAGVIAYLFERCDIFEDPEVLP